MVRRRVGPTTATPVPGRGPAGPEKGGEKARRSRPLHSRLLASDGRVWALCLAFRVVNSLLVQTYFDPDEHWQSLEVAHRIAFGYGHLTWEWKVGIRSYLHPLVFVPLYKMLAFLRLDSPWFMMRAPRLLQSLFSSVGDLYVYKLSHLIFDEHVASWALFCQLTNWFNFFCMPRTYSNCLETVLTIVSLFYWYSFKTYSNNCETALRKWALFLSALACAVRPTSAITWLYVGFLSLLKVKDRMKFLFFEVIPIGVLVCTMLCLLDRWMYGSWVIVPLNFLKFNFLSSGGDYYGTHKWHWYFTQGFPAMGFTFIPLSLHGIYKSKEWGLSGLISWTLLIYSLLGHKEFRFVLPMLPLALIFSGYSLAKMSCHASGNRWHSFRLLIVLFLILTNVPMALYTSLFHQRGREDVMNFLAHETQKEKVKSILFLMPCHATPYYSTLHHDLPMRFLDCSPSSMKGYVDESDRFKMDPVNFVLVMAKNWTSFSHIILFDHEEAQLRELLDSFSYSEVKRFFNSHFPVDGVSQSFIHVYSIRHY